MVSWSRLSSREPREERRERHRHAAVRARTNSNQTCRSSSVTDTFEKARLLRSWHREPRLLVLPNAWDVASAVALARVPGCRALATTSGGVARSLGYEDGAAPADEMLRVAARIAAAVDVPVSADLERGYEDPPATVRTAWDAGIVGANIEDSVGGEPPVAVDDQVELLRAVRAAAPE